MLETTAGQILVNEALPPELRDYSRTMTSKELKSVLKQVADKYPEKYKEVSKKLLDAGSDAASASGGYSLGLQDLIADDDMEKDRDEIRKNVMRILRKDADPVKAKDELVTYLQGKQSDYYKRLSDRASAKGNPLATLVNAGARGNINSLAGLLGGHLLYADGEGKPIPVPVLSSYSEGISPFEHSASLFGARAGLVSVKMATQRAGYLSKQLVQLAHRNVIVDHDDPDYDPESKRGLPTDIDDDDNDGALLAADFGPYKRNTPVSKRMRENLRKLGIKDILVRSPMVGSPADGVYAADVGVRESGGIPGIGTVVGNPAAQAIGEPIAQGSLSAKHGGGVAGSNKLIGGFPLLNQLIQEPKIFQSGATHTDTDGVVSDIKESSVGGWDVKVGDKSYYVPKGLDVTVKKGDSVEAGDVLSGGYPVPHIITKHKGIGEGRRYFARAFTDAMRNSGMRVNRRNVELIANQLVNHVELDQELDRYVPDDVVSYQWLERNYTPRETSRKLNLTEADGKYLERPVLHYSIGTRITPSVSKMLQRYKVPSVHVDDNPPPFRPVMIRGMANLQYDKDPFVRMFGGYQEKGLLDSTHRGLVADEAGTSFVPSLMRSVDFGNPSYKVRSPGPTIKPLGDDKPLSFPEKIACIGEMLKEATLPFQRQLPHEGLDFMKPKPRINAATSNSPTVGNTPELQSRFQQGDITALAPQEFRTLVGDSTKALPQSPIGYSSQSEGAMTDQQQDYQRRSMFGRTNYQSDPRMKMHAPPTLPMTQVPRAPSMPQYSAALPPGQSSPKAVAGAAPQVYQQTEKQLGQPNATPQQWADNIAYQQRIMLAHDRQNTPALFRGMREMFPTSDYSGQAAVTELQRQLAEKEQALGGRPALMNQLQQDIANAGTDFARARAQMIYDAASSAPYGDYSKMTINPYLGRDLQVSHIMQQVKPENLEDFKRNVDAIPQGKVLESLRRAKMKGVVQPVYDYLNKNTVDGAGDVLDLFATPAMTDPAKSRLGGEVVTRTLKPPVQAGWWGAKKIWNAMRGKKVVDAVEGASEAAKLTEAVPAAAKATNRTGFLNKLFAPLHLGVETYKALDSTHEEDLQNWKDLQAKNLSGVERWANPVTTWDSNFMLNPAKNWMAAAAAMNDAARTTGQNKVMEATNAIRDKYKNLPGVYAEFMRNNHPNYNPEANPQDLRAKAQEYVASLPPEKRYNDLPLVDIMTQGVDAPRDQDQVLRSMVQAANNSLLADKTKRLSDLIARGTREQQEKGFNTLTPEELQLISQSLQQGSSALNKRVGPAGHNLPDQNMFEGMNLLLTKRLRDAAANGDISTSMLRQQDALLDTVDSYKTQLPSHLRKQLLRGFADSYKDLSPAAAQKAYERLAELNDSKSLAQQAPDTPLVDKIYRELDRNAFRRGMLPVVAKKNNMSVEQLQALSPAEQTVLIQKVLEGMKSQGKTSIPGLNDTGPQPEFAYPMQ